MKVSPSVSVSVVSDYRGGEQKSWDDLRRTLEALARQNYDGAVEFLLIENRADLENMPENLRQALPGMRVIPCDATGSYEMKNIAIQETDAELVMLLDADCTPEPGWISAGVEAMISHPDAVAISGRTVYPGRTVLEKALGLLSRSYVDRGSAGEIRLLSTNNMIGQRQQFCTDPLPEGTGPFAYRMVTESWYRQGLKLFFEPDMKVVHDFEGWSMEKDLRRQVGWTSMRIRQLDSAIPGAGIVRALGVASIPLLYLYRLVESTGRSLRLTQYFDLHWWHVPYLLGLALRVHGFEIPGMLNALRGQNAGPTVYR